MEKFETLKKNFSAAQNQFWREIQETLYQPKYRERLVVKIKDGIRLIETKQIAFIQMQNEIPFAFDANGGKFALGETTDESRKTA